MAQANTPPGEWWLGSFGPGEQVLGADAHREPSAPEPPERSEPPEPAAAAPPVIAPPSWGTERRRRGERGPLESVRWWARRAG